MTIDLQPTLSGPHLTLRPMTPDDWSGLYSVASDPLIWAIHPAKDRWQEAVFRRYFDEGIESGGALVVIDRASGVIIGSSRYFGHEPHHQSIEIGWTFLARAHWGGATNRELKSLMLRHIFGYVDRVTFRVGADNLRSRRAVEKIGGVLTEMRDVREMAGVEVVHVLYAITKDAFLASPLNVAIE